MTQDYKMDYDKAAMHWIEADKDTVKMEPKALKEKIDAYISRHNTCALSTADGDFVRCTPIEYVYSKDCFWLFSEGGLKFKALKNNKNVCLAIYDEYQGFGQLNGMQITGTAEIIEPFSESYLETASVRGLSRTALEKLPQPLNLIKIEPKVIDFLSSDFKKEGYANRQQLVI